MVTQDLEAPRISSTDAPVLYQVATQHWTHAEQVRWTVLSS